MDLGGMLYISRFIKIDSAIQKLMEGQYTHGHTDSMVIA
jgi:hypothetical protein